VETVSTVKLVTRHRIREDQIVEEGYEVLRVLFEASGPAIIINDATEELLRGENGEMLRQIIIDSVTAALNRASAN
jgi:hypothetical protein